jgi:hypothetical protein
MSIVINNLLRQKANRIREAKANGTYVEQPEPFKLTAETTMGRFLQAAQDAAFLTVIATATVAVAVGTAVAAAGMGSYIQGAVHPTDYHSQPLSKLGAQHVKQVGGFVDGLRVAVETNLQTLSTKVFVDDVAANAPGQEQVGAMKTSMDAQLQQLHRKASDMKKAQEPTLELISSRERYL